MRKLSLYTKIFIGIMIIFLIPILYSLHLSTEPMIGECTTIDADFNDMCIKRRDFIDLSTYFLLMPVVSIIYIVSFIILPIKVWGELSTYITNTRKYLKSVTEENGFKKPEGPVLKQSFAMERGEEAKKAMKNLKVLIILSSCLFFISLLFSSASGPELYSHFTRNPQEEAVEIVENKLDWGRKVSPGYVADDIEAQFEYWATSQEEAKIMYTKRYLSKLTFSLFGVFVGIFLIFDLGKKYKLISKKQEKQAES